MKNLKNENGIALIATLLFLMAMGVLSAALIFTTQNEMKASTAYKYSQQALFAADAGVQNAVQWFADTYRANTNEALYDNTASPVKLASNSKNVIFTGQTATDEQATYYYPIGEIGDSFKNNVGQKTLTLDPATDSSPLLGRYSVTATLLKYTRVTFVDPASDFTPSDGAMERWLISSTGTWGPSSANPLGIAQITAVVENAGCSLFQNALWGKRYVDLKGVSFIDSYDSRFAYDSVTNHGYLGAIGSNGTLSGGNNVTVRGDVAYGPTGSINLGSGTTITGSVVQLSEPRQFPSVDDSFAVGNGTTGSVGNNDPDLTLPNPPGNYYYGKATVHGTLILSQGTYYFDSLTVGGQGEIKVTGDVKIYVKSGFDVQGNGFVNETGNPTNLDIFYAVKGSKPGDTAKLRGSSSVNIQFYGPDAPLELVGGSDYFGSFVADTIDCTGNTAVHFSEGSLTDNIVKRPFKLITWSQNSN